MAGRFAFCPMMKKEHDNSCRWITGRVFLAWLLILAYFAVSIHMALRVPCGYIKYLHLAGGAVGNYAEPDAFYMSAGVSFFREPYIAYPGHPGMGLQALVGTTSELAYRISGNRGGDADYYGFVLRNWIHILVVLRILMTFVSLGCVFLVYGLARYCTNTTGWAVVAAALYATSYPVLLYINRLAPTPLAIMFSLAAIYCLWRAIHTRQDGREGRAAAWLALVGVAAVATCFEKFYIGFLLLPVLAFGWFLEWHTWTGCNGWKKALPFAGTLVLSMLVVALLYMQKLNIDAFLGLWRGESAYRMEDRGGGVKWSLGFILNLFSRFSLVGSPDRVKGGILLLCEIPLLLCGCLGLTSFRDQDSAGRRRTLTLIMFGLTTVGPMIGRGAWTWTPYSFEYVYPLVAAASVLSAQALQKWIGGLCHPGHTAFSSWRPLVLAGCIVLLLHRNALTMFVTTERGLARSYKSTTQPYVRALARLPAGKRIGVNLDGQLNATRPVFPNFYMLGIVPPDLAGWDGFVESPCWRFADRLFCITNGAGPVAWPDDVAVVIADEIESWPPRDSGCVP